MISKIKTFAASFYDKSDDLHGLPHIQRVLRNSHRIYSKEGGNWNLIETIIWLHDIGRRDEKLQKNHHAQYSAELAQNLFQKLKIPEDLQEKITHGILAHSFSIGGKPKFLEAKIVSDADKLDALGAVGIFRVCAYQALHHQGINEVLAHCDDKLFKLIDLMFLPTSKKIAKERVQRIRRFQQDMLEELRD
ncbi:MAG: HD domain-containing protein [Promethearchaeota archaeon]